jgi:hypothetical protein
MQEESSQRNPSSLADVSITSGIRGVFDVEANRGASGITLRGLSLRFGRSHGAAKTGRFKSAFGAEIAVLLMILIMIAALCLGLDARTSKAVEQEVSRVWHLIGGMFSHGEAQLRSRPAAALLVSSQERDYVRVVGTLSPRGVPVAWAPNLSAGLRLVSDTQFSAGMLVIDGELPYMKDLVQQFKRRFPELTVLVLKPDRDPAIMAAAMMTFAEQAKRP